MACLAVVALLSACTANRRAERINLLPADSRALYDKYDQFFTDLQRDQFLDLPGDIERQQFVANLHIEERLAAFTAPVREAIWRKEVIAGMDKPAVLLSVGVPVLREVDEQAKMDSGNDIERWTYRRGVSTQSTTVVLVNGIVTEVIVEGAPK